MKKGLSGREKSITRRKGPWDGKTKTTLGSERLFLNTYVTTDYRKCKYLQQGWIRDSDLPVSQPPPPPKKKNIFIIIITIILKKYQRVYWFKRLIYFSFSCWEKLKYHYITNWTVPSIKLWSTEKFRCQINIAVSKELWVYYGCKSSPSFRIPWKSLSCEFRNTTFFHHDRSPLLPNHDEDICHFPPSFKAIKR